VECVASGKASKILSCNASMISKVATGWTQGCYRHRDEKPIRGRHLKEAAHLSLLRSRAQEICFLAVPGPGQRLRTPHRTAEDYFLPLLGVATRLRHRDVDFAPRSPAVHSATHRTHVASEEETWLYRRACLRVAKPPTGDSKPSLRGLSIQPNSLHFLTPMAEHDSDDESLDHGMQDPVVLRGLLQCIAIGLFFSGRYLLDVLFTPHVVQQALALAHRVWAAAWCAPAISLVLLHYWGSLEYGLFSVLARWLLRFCILRSLIVKLMDDEMVVWHLRKVHIWVPLQFLVTFTRVSSGREEPRGEWQGGGRSVLCRGMPWVIRYSVLSASWPSLRVTDVFAQLTMTESDLWPSPSYAPSYAPSFEPQGCASFTGFAVPCEELRRIREFNRDVMPTLRDAGYRAIRKAMNERSFPGHIWHVGHACPDPSKKSTRNEEDFGWNLFAQHAVDNANLGHCLVSCAEAEHLGASHVRCTRSEGCVQTCSDSWW
jgi:hypothetical protein